MIQAMEIAGTPQERQQVKGRASTWGSSGACGGSAFLTFKEILLLAT